MSIIAMLTAGGLIGALIPPTIAWGLNEGLLDGAVNLFILGAGCTLGIAGYLVTSVINAARTILTSKLGAQLAKDLRQNAYDQLTALELNNLRSRHSSEYIARIVADASVISGVPAVLSNQILGSIVSASAVVGAMVMLNPSLTLIAVSLALPGAILLRGHAKRVRLAALSAHSDLERLLSAVSEGFNIEFIVNTRIYGREGWSRSRFESANTAEAWSNARRQNVGTWRLALLNAMLLSTPAAMYMIVGVSGINSLIQVETGTLMTFTALQVALPYSLVGVLNASFELEALRGVIGRVSSDIMLGHVKKNPRSHSIVDTSPAGCLIVTNLEVAYPPNDPLFSGFTGTATPGEKIVVRGATGSGKSSLLSIIAGLLEPSAGFVQIGSSPDAPIEYVPQRAYFFSGTIRENLRLARDVDDETLWAALALVELRARVSDMPEGLDTRIGDGGLDLSGGEKQRLALARATLRNAAIILLDESMSALDPATRREVTRRLWKLWRERTVLYVTHDLDAIPEWSQTWTVSPGSVKARSNLQDRSNATGPDHPHGREERTGDGFGLGRECERLG